MIFPAKCFHLKVSTRRQRKRKKIRGKYRKQLHQSFDKIKSNQRNIAKATFSVIKRKFGETLRTIKFRNRIKEIKVKLIVYNIECTI
jgi:hypothetical protein